MKTLPNSRKTREGSSLRRMVGRDLFRLADGMECRNAETHGANIKFEYRNSFGWQTAYMPPWTECEAPNDRTEPRQK